MERHGDGHGKFSPEYRAWQAMKRRCWNPNDVRYERYGGRGIKICDRWMSSYIDFLKDMGRKPTQKHTLDRINLDGNYEPSNCRWATPEQQMRNRRNNVVITINGISKSACEWAETTKVSAYVIRKRIHRGWTGEEALFAPLGTRMLRNKNRPQPSFAFVGNQTVFI